MSSTKSVYIDLAYADWTFAPGARVVLGKQKQPYWRTGQSPFFDADINPEGAAVTYERGWFFGSAYGWMLQENYSSDPQGRNQDPRLLGAQAGVEFGWLGGETRVVSHYYDCSACQGNAPYWSGGNAYGNTTNADGSLQVLRYDYDGLLLQAQVGATLAGLPLQVWGDWARNLASGVEYDTAFDVGVMLGRAADRRTWEAGLLFQSMDKDAMFAQLVVSDFAATYELPAWGISFLNRSTVNLFYDRIRYDYDDFRDVRAGGTPGTEPLYGFDADVFRLFLSGWF